MMKKFIFSGLLTLSLATTIPTQPVNFSMIKTGSFILAKSVATFATGMATCTTAIATGTFGIAAMNSELLIPSFKSNQTTIVSFGFCSLLSGYLTYKGWQLSGKLVESLAQDIVRTTTPSNMTINYY